MRAHRTVVNLSENDTRAALPQHASRDIALPGRLIIDGITANVTHEVPSRADFIVSVSPARRGVANLSADDLSGRLIIAIASIHSNDATHVTTAPVHAWPMVVSRDRASGPDRIAHGLAIGVLKVHALPIAIDTTGRPLIGTMRAA
jgi:hypothetical protein